MVSAMSLCAVSPKNPSPLSSYPPFRPQSCSPPPALENPSWKGLQSAPLPITTRSPQTGQHQLLTPDRTRHPNSIPSPSSSAALDGPLPNSPEGSNNMSPSPSQRRTSRSLAGSYTLSLLSSRMSHAHTPHSLPSAFTVQIGATAMGSSSTMTTRKVQSPAHVKVPFEGRWYDLEGGPGGAAVGTPWVGCVDLEGYYTRQECGLGDSEREKGSVPRRGRSPTMPSDRPQPTRNPSSIYNGLGGSSTTRDRKRSPSFPREPASSLARSHTTGRAGLKGRPETPPFPGYELAPQGLLQLVIKNDVQALKVFLIKYDLNALEVGGKMLVRERNYEAVQPGPTGSSPPVDRRREILRSAVELQFTCVEVPSEKRRKKKRHTEPAQSRWQEGLGISDTRTRMDASVSIDTEPWSYSMTAGSLGMVEKKQPPSTSKTEKAYFLSKHIRVVFCGNLTGRNQADKKEVPKEDVRTERFIEVINPSTVQPGMSTKEIKKLRRASFASESWEGVKALLSRRMKEDKEDEAVDNLIGSTNFAGRVSRPNSPLPPITFERSITPVQAHSSLLSARLGRRDGSIDAQAEDDDDEEESAPGFKNWHREIGLDPMIPSPVTSPIEKKRSLWPEDESERMLSESLQRLPWRR